MKTQSQLAEYAQALLDTCDDLDACMPTSPYSMSITQLDVARRIVEIRNRAHWILQASRSR